MKREADGAIHFLEDRSVSVGGRPFAPLRSESGWPFAPLSMPVIAVSAVRNDCSQLAKQAWKAAGFSVIRTRRKTSLRDAVGQVEHLQEKPFFQAHPASDRGWPGGAGEHRQQAPTSTLTRGCR